MAATAGLFRNRQSCKLSSFSWGACRRNHSNSRSGIAHELKERHSSAGGKDGNDDDVEDDDEGEEVVELAEGEEEVVAAEVVPRRLARRAEISMAACRSRE